MRWPVRGDRRSRRVAVVPDAVVNPAPGDRDRLAELAEAGWGVVALCPPALEPDVAAAWLVPIVEQVVTFLDDGYLVARYPADGDPEMERFTAALAAAGREVTDVVAV